MLFTSDRIFFFFFLFFSFFFLSSFLSFLFPGLPSSFDSFSLYLLFFIFLFSCVVLKDISQRDVARLDIVILPFLSFPSSHCLCNPISPSFKWICQFPKFSVQGYIFCLQLQPNNPRGHCLPPLCFPLSHSNIFPPCT